MQSMQRQFGKLWNKAPGDNAKVSVVLKDYEDADKVLAQLVENTQLWRDSWVTLLDSQLAIIIEYESLYDPIVGASDGHGREATPTPELQLTRTFKLKEAYAELRTELVEEIAMIEERIIKPGVDARDCIAPIRKTIKKRENKRLDYEKAQEKFNKLYRKPGRTPKEESALSKAEMEVANAAEEFNIADAHLRETLPPIVAAAFTIIPPLLATMVLIQNRLLGLYYTTVHGYCEEFGFPSPPPPMDSVVNNWSAAFKPIQKEIEALNCIARGKAVHQSMTLGNDPNARKLSTAPVNSRLDPTRRSSSNLIPNNAPQQRNLRIPSVSSTPRSPSPAPSRDDDPSPRPSPRPGPRPDYLAPTDFTTATILGQSPGASPNSMRPRNDYFSARPGTAASSVSSVSLNTYSNGGSGMSSAGMVVGKKKPPPPPPPKRIPSTKPPDDFVVAKYSFTGQGQGDLSFQENDVIRIVKRTQTDQDWWIGELNGRQGNFPANYCRPR